uniref:Uncharacterized protein n=1 Tax=Arundo donax TaxID=35708 RepID=A0A0A9BYU9_ARUDO
MKFEYNRCISKEKTSNISFKTIGQCRCAFITYAV